MFYKKDMPTSLKECYETDDVSRKLSQYQIPYKQLVIPYGPLTSKSYTEENDRFLICCLAEVFLLE